MTSLPIHEQTPASLEWVLTPTHLKLGDHIAIPLADDESGLVVVDHDTTATTSFNNPLLPLITPVLYVLCPFPHPPRRPRIPSASRLTGRAVRQTWHLREPAAPCRPGTCAGLRG